jgi:hypothetical protein
VRRVRGIQQLFGASHLARYFLGFGCILESFHFPNCPLVDTALAATIRGSPLPHPPRLSVPSSGPGRLIPRAKMIPAAKRCAVARALKGSVWCGGICRRWNAPACSSVLGSNSSKLSASQSTDWPLQQAAPARNVLTALGVSLVEPFHETPYHQEGT